MTDVTHLSLEVLADLQEGLLADSEAARCRQHLAACEVCRTRQAELDDVRATLGAAAQAETRVPEPVADRIHHALREAAEEESATAAGSASQQSQQPEPSTVTPIGSRRHRMWRGLAAAAAVVVIAAVGVGAWQGLQSEGGSSGVSAGSAAAPTPPKQQDEGSSAAGGSAAGRAPTPSASAQHRSTGQDAVEPDHASPGNIQRLPSVDPVDVDTTARRLASHKVQPVPVEPRCTMPDSTGSLTSLVRWRKEDLAVLTIFPKQQRAKVLSCTTGTVLYATHYRR